MGSSDDCKDFTSSVGDFNFSVCNISFTDEVSIIGTSLTMGSSDDCGDFTSSFLVSEEFDPSLTLSVVIRSAAAASSGEVLFSDSGFILLSNSVNSFTSSLRVSEDFEASVLASEGVLLSSDARVIIFSGSLVSVTIG